MKTMTILCCGAALGLTQTAYAQLPGDALGQLTAIIDYCAHVDPKNAASYQGWARSVLDSGLSPMQRASLIKSALYRNAYRDAAAALAGVSAADGKQDCQTLVPPVGGGSGGQGSGSGGGSHGKRH